MSRTTRVRVLALCEDRRSRDFAWATCEALGIPRRDVDMDVAPAGSGSGKAWVRLHYADRANGRVQELRSKNFQPQLALLVLTDGDEDGVDKRIRQLDEALAEQQLNERGDKDPITILVPTWSIETWLLWLWGEREIDEHASYKEDGRAGGPERSKLFRERAKDCRVADAAAAFVSAPPDPKETERLSSLAKARGELKRLPRGPRGPSHPS